MAVNDHPSRDLGLVYFKLGILAGQTYVDRRGKATDAELLTDSYTPMLGTQAVETATHWAGMPTAHSYWVRIVSGSGLSIRLLGQYANDADPTYGIDLDGADPTDWGEAIQLVSQNTGVIANEFTGLTTGVYLFQTASAHTAGRLRWECKTVTEGGEESAWVRIAGRAV